MVSRLCFVQGVNSCVCKYSKTGSFVREGGAEPLLCVKPHFC